LKPSLLILLYQKGYINLKPKIKKKNVPKDLVITMDVIVLYIHKRIIIIIIIIIIYVL